jgi:uncharacterized protein
MLIYFRAMSPSRMPHHAAANGGVLTRCSPLQIHHAECEVNFLRLQKLLPGFENGQSRGIGLRIHASHAEMVELRVMSRQPYTADVVLRQGRPVWGDKAAELQIRVYLDARMAEVVGSAHVRRLLPRYDYPNPRMLARDEKWQSDRLLGEWLSSCLSHGHALHDTPAPVEG